MEGCIKGEINRSYAQLMVKLRVGKEIEKYVLSFSGFWLFVGLWGFYLSSKFFIMKF